MTVKSGCWSLSAKRIMRRLFCNLPLEWTAQPDNVTFLMGGRLTFLDIAGFGSELRTDFQFGNTYGIATEFYKRFTETSRWFFAPRVSASDAAQWIYSYSDPKADYRVGRAGVGVDIGYALSRFSEVRAGIPQYFLGGTAGLFAYGQNEVRGDQYYLFRAGYLHRLFTLPPFLGTGLYAVTFYEVGKMYNAPGVSRLPNDGTAGVIVRTALGPAFIGGSVGDTGHAKWFFALGRVF